MTQRKLVYRADLQECTHAEQVNCRTTLRDILHLMTPNTQDQKDMQLAEDSVKTSNKSENDI